METVTLFSNGKIKNEKNELVAFYDFDLGVLHINNACRGCSVEEAMDIVGLGK